MRAAVNGRARSTWSTTPPRQRALHVAAAAAQGVEREWQPSRRQLVAGAPAAVAALLVVQPVRAAEEQQQQAGAGLYTVYTDAQDKFSINIPARSVCSPEPLFSASCCPPPKAPPPYPPHTHTLTHITPPFLLQLGLWHCQPRGGGWGAAQTPGHPVQQRRGPAPCGGLVPAGHPRRQRGSHHLTLERGVHQPGQPWASRGARR